MVLTCGGGELLCPVRYWAQVAEPGHGQPRCLAACRRAQVGCLPICPWRTGLDVCIPLGVESGLRGGGREQSATLNRLGHQKALEVLFMWTIILFCILPLPGVGAQLLLLGARFSYLPPLHY